MKVIQCDKCKKILSGTDNRFETVNLRHDGFIDLCDECEIKYEDMRKEYSDFEENTKEIFSFALKEKREELDKKYFNKE